ncbi:MAG: phosphoenolpyruvate--protein phosphotransferase [Agarilytica sp.]
MLNSLRQIVQEVIAASELDEVLDIIVKRVKSAMAADVCSVYLRNPDGDYLLMATEGLDPDSVGKVVLPKKRGLVGHVVAREEPINVHNAELHPKYEYFPETGEEKFSTFLGAPIIHHRQVLGVLVVQQAENRKFDEGDEAFLVTMSAQLASVIAHAEATGALRSIGGPKRETRFSGIPGATGIAIGQCVVSSPLSDLKSVPYHKCDDVDAEIVFFQRCLGAVRNDVKNLGLELEDRLNKEERILFDAYLAMLDDESLGGEVTERIKEGCSAQYAWSQVILEHVSTFNSMSDPYLRERASDVRDLGSRVLAYLQKLSTHRNTYPEKTILVGEDLTASVLAEVPKGQLVGMISLRGSINSHIAILARSMGIPTIMGAVDIPFTQLEGHELILDGYRGTIIVDPSDALREQYQAIIEEDKELVAGLETLKDLPCETTDKHRVALWVNTGLKADAMRSLERGAEGVGLYRTEVPFMLRDRFPSEEEQRVAYRDQLETFAPHTVTMRTLDIGGDKSLPYFPISEDNPFLGWRGIRVTLDHPEIFLTQVRAMLKASEGLGNLRIMLPMISNVAELEIAQMLIYRAYDELLEEGYHVELPPIGVMVEVPAAVYQAREFAARVDFMSVGSNDLTQYLLAVDRNNARVADLYHSLHPAVLRALKQVVDDAHAEDVTVSICGELAGDPAAAPILVAMGFDVLSMSASNLMKVKSVIRAISLEQSKKLLDELMALPDADSINRCLEAAFKQYGLTRILRPESAEDE